MDSIKGHCDQSGTAVACMHKSEMSTEDDIESIVGSLTARKFEDIWVREVFLVND